MRFMWAILFSLFFSVSAAWAKPAGEAFGQLPIIADAAISPDGTKIAAYVNYEGNYGLGPIHNCLHN